MKEKKIHLEILRIIAIFFVIYNHTDIIGWRKFETTDNIFLYNFYLFMSVFCKINVPIFFMISGSLILNKNETIKQLYKKRIFKYILVIAILSILKYMWYIQIGNDIEITNFDFNYFLKTVYSGFKLSNWFLYFYVALMILLPFIRKLIRNLSRVEFVYFVALYLIFVGVLPTIEYVLNIGNINLNMSMVTNVGVFYFLMGYYCENLDFKFYNKRFAIITIICSLIVIAITCWITIYQYNMTGVYTEQFYQNFIAIPTFTVFYLTRYFCLKITLSQRVRKIICIAGESAFGIFLFEEYLRYKLLFIYEYLDNYMFSYFACILWIIILMLFGIIIVTILRRIPGIRRLL